MESNLNFFSEQSLAGQTASQLSLAGAGANNSEINSSLVKEKSRAGRKRLRIPGALAFSTDKHTRDKSK
jgi:hypothetical protein